jgi:xanthosine utilization system XapX-like protein
MKKSLILTTLVFLMLGAVAMAAENATVTAPGCIPPFNLLNSVWVGNLTIVQTDGTTETVPATLSVLTQTDTAFSGELILSTSPDPPIIAFSGIIGLFCDKELYMTAENIVMNGAIKRIYGQQVLKLRLRGQNVSDGSTFNGALLLQQ